MVVVISERVVGSIEVTKTLETEPDQTVLMAFLRSPSAPSSPKKMVAVGGLELFSSGVPTLVVWVADALVAAVGELILP